MAGLQRQLLPEPCRDRVAVLEKWRQKVRQVQTLLNRWANLAIVALMIIMSYDH